MCINIQLYEELSMNALPALRTVLYDGWVLRFSDGYGNRANSVSPIYASSLPPEEKVKTCELMYAAYGLPTVFKLTEASPEGLDGYLAGLGYEAVRPTFLYTAKLQAGRRESGSPGGAGFPGEKLLIADSVAKDWLEDCFRLEGFDEKTAATASAMLSNLRHGVLTARAFEGGKAVACGLCAVERRYAGLYYIATDAGHRRRGFGTAICRELLSAAAETGAKSAYLQVMEDNAAALALYEKLGFGFCYRYWYRILRRRD